MAMTIIWFAALALTLFGPCVLLVLHLLQVRMFSKWRKRGFPVIGSPKVLGHLQDVFNEKRNFWEQCTYLYSETPGEKTTIYSTFSGGIVIIRNLDIVRDIFVKHFDSFPDLPVSIDEKSDPIASRITFFLKADRWRVVHRMASQCFTKTKLKKMFPFVCRVSERLRNEIELRSNNTCSCLDFTALIERYSVDVIQNAAFGVETNILEDHNSKFLELTKSLMKPTFTRIFCFIGYAMCPDIVRYLRLSVIDKKCDSFFRQFLKDVVNYRTKNNFKRDDVIDQLIKLNSEGKSFLS